jgi:Zn-finger nucleic acid-binding protein
MPYYDLYCPKCEYVEAQVFHSIHEEHSMCPNCKDVKLESIIYPVSIAGFSTPGGSQFNLSPSKTPSEIKKWLKNRQEINHTVKEQLKKPIVWPDGTVK